MLCGPLTSALGGMRGGYVDLLNPGVVDLRDRVVERGGPLDATATMLTCPSTRTAQLFRSRPAGAPLRPPFHVLAKPTGAICNLDCSYCFFLSKEELYPGSTFRMSDEPAGDVHPPAARVATATPR